MRRDFVFKSFVYVLVLSLFNLQFSSLAYGMTTDERLVSGDYGGPGVALRTSKHDTQDLQLYTHPVGDEKLNSSLHGRLSSPFSGASPEIEKEFGKAISSFKFHKPDDVSSSTLSILRGGVTLVTALVTAAALAALFLSDGGTELFLKGNSADDAFFQAPPYPQSGVIGASCAGVLSFPDTFILSDAFLKGRFFPSKHQYFAEEQDPIRIVGFYVAVLPVLAILMSKIMFAYISTVLAGSPPALFDLQAVAAVPLMAT